MILTSVSKYARLELIRLPESFWLYCDKLYFLKAISMRYLILFLMAVALVALAVLIAGQLGLLRGKAAPDLGLRDGKLKPPSRTPNSVSSQADLWPAHPMQAYARISPLKITGDGSADMQKIAAILAKMPRTVVIKQEPHYIYAQSSTALLKFTDDVEFALNADQGVIDLRSASRLGRQDFGVNRARVEAIALAFAQQSAP
jgi:uncharacterized protein (DUF1499 family)